MRALAPPDAFPGSFDAVFVLRLLTVLVMIFPSDIVLKPIGAAAFPGGLAAMGAFALWAAASLFGLHRPATRRTPTHLALLAVWPCSLASFLVMHLHEQDGFVLRSGDRWIMQLAGWSGAALLAAEALTRLDQIRTVVRSLTNAGAVVGVIAALQFWAGLDLAVYLRMIPGFETAGSTLGIDSRAGLARVAGTALHPIELGVVAAMLLPLAVWLAVYDTSTTPGRRWLRVALIGLCIPTTVSRSAVLAVVASMGTLIVLLPARQRVLGLSLVPAAAAGVFVSARGVIATLASFFTAGSNDSSIANRIEDWSTVERLVALSPWFGHGGGSYLPPHPMLNLDNQFLKSAIELGLVGVSLLGACYLLLPAIVVLRTRRGCGDLELTTLCAALGGAALAATLTTATFDSLSFPMFAHVHALLLGLIGATVVVVRASTSPDPRPKTSALAASPTPRAASRPPS
ncbi:MAG: O-antigen ligase family protein [Acidimicrobiales bacterium]